MNRWIYLDNNATTRPLDAVVEAMLPFLRDQYANPSSVHAFGQSVRHQVDLARQKVAALLGADPREIIFTSGGTESINLAIRGLLTARPERRGVITTSVEHSAVRKLCARLAEEGYPVDEIGVDHDGRLDLAELESKITPQTAIVSVMYANNETGVLSDVAGVAQICQARGVPLHLDAVQALGKVPIDVTCLPVALLSMSAHKCHGPKGVGALYVRRRTPLSPLIIGGTHERNMRAGTEHVAGIVGMGAAAEALANRPDDETAGIARLRDRLERGILAGADSAHVIGQAAERICNTTNIGFEGLAAEAILLLLSENGICASAGAACSSGSLEPSHVLQAMGIDARIAHGAIRFSLSQFTTEAEIDRVVDLLPALLNRLGALSHA